MDYSDQLVQEKDGIIYTLPSLPFMQVQGRLRRLRIIDDFLDKKRMRVNKNG